MTALDVPQAIQLRTRFLEGVGLHVKTERFQIEDEPFVRVVLTRSDGVIIGVDSWPESYGSQGIYASLGMAAGRVSLALVNAMHVYVQNKGTRFPSGEYLAFLQADIATVEQDCRVEE